jgi:hypothetical protein
MNAEKLAIIVPYKDREEDLYKFIGHMEWYLSSKFDDFKIYVIEQESPDLFNYGALCNAAVKILESEGYNYFVFHDLDLLPQEDCDYSDTNMQYPTHMASTIMDTPGFKPYPHYIGGVFKISKDNFYKVNGFSNDYWGGGLEYLDLLYRMNKHIPDSLPTTKIFNTNIFNYHRFIDVIQVDKLINKELASFIFSNGNTLVLQKNDKINHLLSDSFTICFDVFIDVDQSEDGCIIGREGYDTGIFVRNNEAIVFQHWLEDGEMMQIWQPNDNIKGKWCNLCVRVSTITGQASMFVDGKLVNDVYFDNSKSLMDFSSKPFWLGSIGMRNRFKGKISNLIMFDYDLSDNEIDKLYTKNYENGDTTFDAIANIPFSKSFGAFFIDTQNYKSNAKLIKMDNAKHGITENFAYTHKIKAPAEDFGKYKILENSNKFSILEKYYWQDKDPNMVENENIFFYEVTDPKLKNLKYGLSSVSYRIRKEEDINKHTKKITIKFL